MYARTAMAIITAMAAAACQTTGSLNGSGPIALSSKVNRNYQSYLTQVEPLAFAVSADGKSSGRFYCTKELACLKFNEITEAVNDCKNNTPKNSRPCRVFAVKKKIVWNGPVTVAGQRRAEAAPPAATAPVPQSPIKAAAAVGDGPLTVTERVNEDFQNYLNLPEPLAFAVSADGKNSGWFFCRMPNACAAMDAGGNAVKYCNDSAPQGEKTCKILAVKRDVVWKGRVLIAPVQTPY